VQVGLLLSARPGNRKLHLRGGWPLNQFVQHQGGSEGLRSVTILQNIRVIGVDQQSGEDQNQPEIARTITVEVSPEQGQKLALAQRAGTLSLTLRTLDGVIDAPLDMILLRDLMQEKSPLAENEKKPIILIRRANVAEEVTIN
jgi:pilus assembly protein CpaB